MSVHYKFKSALDYDTVTFDGLHISVGDLKAAISQQKRIGKTSDFDLQITNAQTKEVYTDDSTLIPKNTSLLVARIPLSQQPKKQWEGLNNASLVHKDVTVNKGLADLSRMEGSEQDKINAMISQSTFDYDPSNYLKIRGQNQRGTVPSNYICYKCQKQGHWIKDCPLANAQGGESVEIRRSTGIPRSFMVPVDGPKAPGAMMTPSGTFAVPVVDHEAYLASENAGGADGAAVPTAPEPTIPDELICSLCRDLLTDAVMIPCCGNSFCDECIRGALLESEDHECPDCREKEISPGTLIPNRFLRNSVSAFRNQTGYSRRTPHRPAAVPQPKPVQEHPPVTAPHLPPNGQSSAPIISSGVRRAGPGEESDGSQDDNITVTVPPCARRPRERRRAYGPPPMGKPQMDMPQTNQPRMRMEEQRASTPTVDERRDPISSQPYNRDNRGPPSYGPSQGGPSNQRYNIAYGRPPPGPRYDSYPLEPYQPPPPGIKDSPSERLDEDPLEAFNRMIREKEARAKRREEERRRLHSPSPRARARSPRSPRPRSRSPPPARSRSRSPPPPARASPTRVRYTRSRSISRGRRRSPWSPRRRRSRERTLSLTRSPSPRRRHRSPLRYRSPLRSPAARSPPRGSPHSLARSPHRSPHLPTGLRSPRSAISPQRYIGVYDELLSPTRRSVEPLYGPRYGPRNHGPPPSYPPIGMKPVPPMGNLSTHQEPPGYRGRYDGPPFDDIPPGVDPPIPGYEPSPFEKPPLGPPVLNDRERLAPMNYRESYRPSPYADGPSPAFRDLAPGQKDIPLHLSEPQRFRDSYRGGPTGPPYRDQGPIQYRDGQSFRDPALQQPYRDANFRGGPPPGFRDNYRNNSHIPYRDNGPNFRDASLPNFREGPGPYRPPSVEQRDVVPPAYHDPNFRDGYRDIPPPQEHVRSTVRQNNRNRGGPRRNLNVDHERHKESSRSEREVRDRERYNENREPAEKNREPDKKAQYERSRDDRIREYDKNRDYVDKERDRDRDHEKNTPEKILKSSSPKRSRAGESRDKKRSESRGRSRERDKRDKKEERSRDKSSTERTREHKEKDRKLKERDKKKKKREKEAEKRKKRDKKEKKEKELPKQDDVNIKTEEVEEKTNKKEEPPITIKQENVLSRSEIPLKILTENVNKLYGKEAVGEIDKDIIKNYVKKEIDAVDKKTQDVSNKEEPNFDGIELQVTAEELDLKVDAENSEKEMLAPVPELSKWEVDEDNPGEKVKEPGEITSPDEEEDRSKITSEVIKRAENAIFAKTIASLRPIEIKKISNDRAKLYTDDSKVNAKNTMNNIQVTVPVTDPENRSVEVSEKKNKHSKTPPRLSVKDRLGGKVDEMRRPREDRIVQSAVARVKSKSKTPKRDQPYRRVTVDRDRGRRLSNKSEDGHRFPSVKANDKGFTSETIVEKEVKDIKKSDKKGKLENENNKLKDSDTKNREKEAHAFAERERKRSVLDEAHFEPDYDETVESDSEVKEEANSKKRERSKSPEDDIAAKKSKTDDETIKLDLTNVKKKPETGSESSSDSSSSSSSSEEVRKRKRKRKRSKRKKKRVASDSESESDSSSDDHKKKKKKRKHKKKSSKKKKKSKHK